MHSIKSYTDLKKIIKYYCLWVEENEQEGPLGQLNLLKNNCLIVSLGLIWLNKDLTEIVDFQANRYFIDSINVNSLPTENELKTFASQDTLNKALFLIFKKNFENNYLGIVELAKKILHNFSESIGFNKEIQNQWSENSSKFYNENGYVVIPKVLSHDQCDEYREIILKVAEEEKLNGQGYLYGFHNRFQRIYNLINKSQKLGRLLTLPLVNLIMNDLFDRDTFHDKYTLSSWHSNIIGAKGEEQKLHIDSAVPEPIPPWIIRANINFILEDYTDTNGSTVCLPGSHKFLRKPSKSDEEKYQNKFIKMTAPKGSMVIWSGHLWHKSGQNNTNKERVALLACFASSHLIEMALEENHPLIIDNDNLSFFSSDLKKLLLFNHGLKQGSKSKSKFFFD
jgi:hypothetical protein